MEPGTRRIEAQLASIWQDVLQRETVDRDDHFLDLGGNSISALQIIATVEDRFGVELSLQDFFAHPTITRLATALRARAARPVCPTTARSQSVRRSS